MRIALIMNMVAPYTAPLFAGLAARDECEVLVVTETSMERDRRWEPETDLSFDHVQLESWTVDLAPLAIGSGFKTRFDTYLYVPKRPLAPLRSFRPDVVVAGGGGIWSSPANIAALSARWRRHWAFVPWWGSFSRDRPTWPRRLAEPWVRTFMRVSDAWLVYGTRQRRDILALGADPARIVTAPITALAPDPPVRRSGPLAPGCIRYLFVGRLIERKGLHVLLEAFESLGRGSSGSPATGHCAGRAEAAAACNPQLRLIGHVAGDALADVYRRADVLIVPSLYEPWGLVVHEGLANGLPVIVTDQVGAGDDLIDHGTNGYVIPVASAEELAGAMRVIASWTSEQWARAGRHSTETLASVSVERAVDGFVLGCSLALEHRRHKMSRRNGSGPLAA